MLFVHALPSEKEYVCMRFIVENMQFYGKFRAYYHTVPPQTVYFWVTENKLRKERFDSVRV